MSGWVGMKPVRVAFHWSGGKDSAHAVNRLLADGRYELAYLVTTFSGTQSMSTVHGLPEHLLQQQADALGVPLHAVWLQSPELADYTEKLGACAEQLRSEGVEAFAFGDLDHSGTHHFRIDLCEPVGLEVVFPLAGLSADECMSAYVESGIESLTVIVDAAILGQEELGQRIDSAFLARLPRGCDPCGENGEYHSFAWNSPDFREPISFCRGRVDYTEHQIGTSAGTQNFAYWRLNLR